MGEMRNVYNNLVGKSEGKRLLEDLGLDLEDNIIRMDLRDIVWESGLDSSGSGQGPMLGPCEHDNETSGSIKGGEFLDGVSNC
jgi:hypothetical protein